MLFVQEQEALVIIVIIGIFFMELDAAMGFNRSKKSFKIILCWHKNLGNIPASQSKISKDIFAQRLKAGLVLITCEHSHRIAVFSQDMGVFPKIVFKIAVRIIASGCNYCVKILEFFCD